MMQEANFNRNNILNSLQTRNIKEKDPFFKLIKSRKH